MFREIFAMELKLIFTRGMVYLFFLLPAIYITGLVLNENFIIPGTTAGVYRNAPFVVTTYAGIISLFGLAGVTFFFNNAALRDYESNFADIYFGLPVSRNICFFARFCAAFVASSFSLSGLFAGIIVATLIGAQTNMVSQQLLGNIPWNSFLLTLLLVIIPNTFICGTFTFILASKWKNTVVSVLGLLFMIGCYAISGILNSNLFSQKLGAFVDVFGIRAYAFDTRYFQAQEKNLVIFHPGDSLLINRLIWLGAGTLLLLVFSRNYKTESLNSKPFNKKKKVAEQVIVPFRFANPLFNNNKLLEIWNFFDIDFSMVVKHAVFKVMALLIVLIFVFTLYSKTEYLGLSALPTTGYIVHMAGDIRDLFIYLLLIFLSGELVWRARQHRFADVLNAAPHTTISSLISKVLVLVMIGSFLILILAITGVLNQLLDGTVKIEWILYLKDFLYRSLPPILIYSLLSISIQYLLNSKYISYTVMVFIVFVLPVIFQAIGVETPLLSPGKVFPALYSDMNGYGTGLIAEGLFHGYWISLSILLLMLAALWTETSSSGAGFSGFRKQFNSRKSYLPVLLVVIWLSSGGFLFYHTQLLNPEDNTTEVQHQVAYERSFKQYSNKDFPALKKVSYFVDIYPGQKQVSSRSELLLVNHTRAPMNEIHFTIQKGWDTRIEVPHSRIVYSNAQLGYRIFKFDHPLQPGKSMGVTIKATAKLNIIKNKVSNTSIADNGTFITNADFLPVIGYDVNKILSVASKRKKYHLSPLTGLPEPGTLSGVKDSNSLLSQGKSGWVEIDAQLSTSANQYALAPGSLIKKWEAKGRNYFYYKIETPAPNFCAFLSARYAVAEKQFKDISLKIYYDPAHKYNIPIMQDAAEKAINYYTTNFGPYLFKELTIGEFPGYEQYAQAFPALIAYSESMGFTVDLKKKKDFNVIQTVIAHEIAHQWWGYQAAPGYAKGAKLLDETLADYSALMVMKQEAKDKEKLSRYLKYIFDYYKRGKSRSGGLEPALYRVDDNKYLYYGKGVQSMYALQDYIGENKVNLALKAYLEEFRFHQHPGSADLLYYIDQQVPDSLKTMVNDWFKNVVLYDFKLNKAQSLKMKNGSYQVKVNCISTKTIQDKTGKLSKVPFNGWVDLAIYADEACTQMISIKRVRMDKENSFIYYTTIKPVTIVVDPCEILLHQNKTAHQITVMSTDKLP